MMHIRTLTAVFFLASLVPIPALAQSAEIADYEANTQDVLRILGIRHLGASVRLPQPVRNVSVRLQFFKDGKEIVGGPGQSFGLGTTEPCDSFEVSVDVADTDKMFFADAPKSHHRIFIKVEENGPDRTVMGSNIDVSKSQFNAELGGASGRITSRYESNDIDENGMVAVPLLYYLAGTSNNRVGMDIEKTLEANPDADILLVTLLYDAKALDSSKSNSSAAGPAR